MGFLNQIPDLSSATAATGSLTTDLDVLTDGIQKLSPSADGSPVSQLWTTLSDLSGQLDIDLSGIDTSLPTSIQTIANSVPPGVMEKVEAIDQAYTVARDFLDSNELVEAISSSGGSITDWATEIAQPLLELVDEHLEDLTDNLIDGEFLSQFNLTLVRIQALTSDFAGNQSDLLPLLVEQLFGVADDALDTVLNHVQSELLVLDPLKPEAITSRLGGLHSTFETAFTEVSTTVTSMDLNDPTAYVDLDTKLTTAESTLNALMVEANSLMGELSSAISGHAWDNLFSTYPDLLDVIDLGDGFSLDDVFDEMQTLLEELFSKLLQAFGPEDIVAKVEALSQQIQDAVAQSPMQQIQPLLEDILEDIQVAIEAVPTEEIRETVMGMIGQVESHVDALGIDTITDGIENAFTEAETFINDNLTGTMQSELITAVNNAADALPTIDASGVVSAVTDAVNEVVALVADVKAELDTQVASLRDILGQLEGLNYEPLANEVIVEIDEVTSTFSQIDANALSDVEKLALQAALAVLNETNLDDALVDGLKQGYHAAEAEFKKLLDKLAGLLAQLQGALSRLDLTSSLDVVDDAFGSARSFLDSINGKLLMQPAYDLSAELEQALSQLSPGDILDGLQDPYDQMMGFVNRVDPDTWTAPLNELYAKIDELLSYLDVTPAFDYLDQLQNDVFDSIRAAILDALDGADLPEPVAGFFAALRPTLETMTNALFNDPQTQLTTLSETYQTEFSLATLLGPLDEAWNAVVDMLEGLPAADLEVVFESIRLTFGVGVAALNPNEVIKQLSTGTGMINAIDPEVILAPALRLPTVSLQWQARVSDAPAEHADAIANISARLEGIAGLTVGAPEGSAYATLVELHTTLADTYQSALNGLNSTEAQASYTRVQGQLDKIIPPFLKSPTSLIRDDIIAGLRAVRPSAKAVPLENVLKHFVTRLQELQTDIEAPITGMISVFGDTLRLINPLALKAQVEGIYQSISDKAHILDPTELADAIRAVFQPLLDLLDVLNPTNLKAQLNATYNNVVSALTGVLTPLLDAVTLAIDEKLRPIREALLAVIEAIEAGIDALLGQLQGSIDELGDLVFNDVLGSVCQAVLNLGQSFDTEIDRIHGKFNQMLQAIPLQGSASASASV
jgi:hypothetical protein